MLTEPEADLIERKGGVDDAHESSSSAGSVVQPKGPVDFQSEEDADAEGQ